MELKSLCFGILFSIAIFSIKSGLGLYYFWHCQLSLKAKLIGILSWIIAYLIIFILAFNTLKNINLLQYFEVIQKVLQSGMSIHVVMALFMGFYGLMLLKRPLDIKSKTYGWLILVIPCPVCLIVILFSVAFLIAYFPDSSQLSVFMTYAVFIIINFLTIILMKLLDSRISYSHEYILGMSMLLIAVYFIISVIVMPQFGDIDKIYRLALYKEEDILSYGRSFWVFLSFVTGSVAFGFIYKIASIRRILNCTSALY